MSSHPFNCNALMNRKLPMGGFAYNPSSSMPPTFLECTSRKYKLVLEKSHLASFSQMRGSQMYGCRGRPGEYFELRWPILSNKKPLM